MAGLRQTAQLLDGLRQRVVALERLELGHDQPRPDQAILEGGRDTVDSVPVPRDQVAAERLAQEAVEGAVVRVRAGGEW
jgi:hypothetical protein